MVHPKPPAFDRPDFLKNPSGHGGKVCACVPLSVCVTRNVHNLEIFFETISLASRKTKLEQAVVQDEEE